MLVDDPRRLGLPPRLCIQLEILLWKSETLLVSQVFSDQKTSVGSLSVGTRRFSSSNDYH
jgi:hypothetical protein